MISATSSTLKASGQLTVARPSARFVVARSLAILCASMIVGCSGTTPKVDNPVLGAAPPRRPGAVVAQLDAAKESSVVGVSYESTATEADEWNEIAGTVDGIPVFTRDVIEADRPRLADFKKRAPPEVYRQQRDKLLMSRLPQYIEQRLLLTAVQEELEAEQMEAVEEQLEKLFLDEIERLKELTKSRNIAELEEKLDGQGTTLGALRKAFFDRQKAGQYLGLKMSKVTPPDRSDIAKEYERRKETEYKQPADVKWQQLWISYSEHGGREGAFEVLKKAVADLKSGTPFDVIIGRYSDGAMKDNAGLWDYATRGSLASKEVEDALFTLPIGEVSRPYDVGKAFQIVRVADRRPDRYTPLADVEDEITKVLARKRQDDAAGAVIGAMWNKAAIKTRFDDEPEWQEMIADRYGSAESADPVP